MVCTPYIALYGVLEEDILILVALRVLKSTSINLIWGPSQIITQKGLAPGWSLVCEIFELLS